MLHFQTLTLNILDSLVNIHYTCTERRRLMKIQEYERAPACRDDAVTDLCEQVKGVPVLFIPGNAGSYRQVRSLAAEAAVHYHEVLQADQDALNAGKRSLDWFTVDFNEDLAAFHGQTLLDQAEYLNEAIAYILKLYHNPNRSMRDSSLPDPTSVILVGHSMGGIVARTMLTLSNHQPDSVNTIVTLAAPHARPPVSFDAEIVYTYKRINDYWRNAYSQLWASDNPLWQVTLISIAGGSLDTIVPSDYATTASLVPPTHGFTVFTSTLPNVWTGMDHLAMVWCDQLRKSVVRALYDVIDAGRSSQTQPRSERMKSFKKWFLTGLEDVAERSPSSGEAKTLLTLEDDSNNFVPAGERLVLRQLGQSSGVKAHLLPIPLDSGKRFTLLTNQDLGKLGQPDLVDVLFCSVFPLHAGQSSVIFSYDMDLSGNTSGATRLACKNALDDVVSLPASTADSKHPYDQAPPFSYLQFDLEQLTEYQFVAVVDKAMDPHPGWLIAEVSSTADSTFEMSKDLTTMIRSGLEINTSLDRPLTMEIRVPSLQSSLLAYKLSINTIPCDDEISLFAPLVRQFIAEPYESKFFVNAKNAEISMHGVAPYMPPPLKARTEAEGFALQIWSDPTCNSTMAITLKVDIPGSMGKLWMRYRTVFAAFPLLIVALVLRKQFKVYDDTGMLVDFVSSCELY
jgi:glycosylphosphatidylinositol deacylase